MAAVTLILNTPVQNTSESTANKRRRVVMPSASHCYLRIYQADNDCYLERSDETDASGKGSSYETIKAGTTQWLYIGRGECAVSCAGTSAVVELTATDAPGI